MFGKVIIFSTDLDRIDIKIVRNDDTHCQQLTILLLTVLFSFFLNERENVENAILLNIIFQLKLIT